VVDVVMPGGAVVDVEVGCAVDVVVDEIAVVVVLAGAVLEVVVAGPKVMVVVDGWAHTIAALSTQTCGPPSRQALMTAFLQGFRNFFSKPGAKRPAWLSQAERASPHCCVHSRLEALVTVLCIVAAGDRVHMRVVPSLQTARPLLLQAWTTTFLQVLRKSWVKPGANAPAWFSQAAMADEHAFLHSLLEAAQPDDKGRASRVTMAPATTAPPKMTGCVRMVWPSPGAGSPTRKRGRPSERWSGANSCRVATYLYGQSGT
jgi:hypothetical protein